MYLAIIFRAQLTLAKLPEAPSDTIWIGETRLIDKGNGDWSGFYDWLRDSAGQIVGVRFWPFEQARFLCDFLGRFPYVRVEGSHRFIEIYFRSDRNIAVGRSDDQAFGGNHIFSADGEWAITFDLKTLASSEAASIDALAVNWEPACVEEVRATSPT